MAPRKQNPSTPTTGTTVPANPVVDPNAYTQQNPVPAGGASSTYSNTGVSENYFVGGNNVSGIIENGQATPFYNLSTYPRELLASYGTDEVARKTFLNKLYSRGWYKGDDKPGGGLSDEDETAVYRLLYAANLTQTPFSKVLSSVKQSPFVSAPSKGVGFRPSSTEDLVEIANRTALSTIGRKLSEEETSKFARSYQASQQTEASGGMTAPNTEVFFKNRIEQKYGAESDGYKYLSAISNVARLMENM